MATFNLADLFELVAAAVPEREALVAGARRLTYAGSTGAATAWRGTGSRVASERASTSRSSPATARNGSRRCSAA
jgi:hypothetical protein